MKTTLLLFTLIVKALLSYGQAAELRQLLAVPYDKVKKDLCRLSYKATTFIYDMNDPRETCDTIHSTVSLDQQGMEILSEYGFSIQRNDTQIVVDHATRSITLSRVQWSYDKLCQQAAQSLLEDCVPVKIFCRTRSGFVDFTIKYKNGSLLDSAEVSFKGPDRVLNKVSMYYSASAITGEPEGRPVVEMRYGDMRFSRQRESGINRLEDVIQIGVAGKLATRGRYSKYKLVNQL
ncbi:hypothetical protein [Candidatus Pollutiaquabacter sp.]|uniref:hypothetical protein n=1 Tax=Candidatus Pollutiaquabacter sp. TaxID=3416354 RepID=UPI003CC2F27E|nr:hypothetical protein [Bacteroidota bacterium]